MKRPRLSIRVKMLLTIVAVLTFAMGSHLILATTLFERDKLAYVFDLNAALVDTLAEQTRASLEVLQDALTLLARDVLSPEVTPDRRERLAQEMFEHRPDILSVEVYTAQGTRLVRQQVFVSSKALERNGLTHLDLADTSRLRLLPLEAIAAAPGSLYVQNSSLPPSTGMITVAFAVKTGRAPAVIAANVSHQRLLRIFGRSTLHETFLVDEQGEVIAHPDAEEVIARRSLAGHALVREAQSSQVTRGVREFDANGTAMLGGYAKVGLGRLTVLTQVPKREALRAGRELIRRSLLWAGVILIAAFIASVVFSRLLTAPLRRLQAATDVVAAGRFDVDVPEGAVDEVGDVARSFARMAQTLEQTQTQLIRSEKMAAFGQLGAGITHEVKNPMTGIIGFAQLGKSEALTDPAKALHLFEMIEKEGKRSNEILTNFLKFARGESATMERLGVNDLVKEAAKVFGHTLHMHQVRLALQLGEAVPDVLGNPSQLEQVLLNLAINAQQAMVKGGNVEIATAGKDGAALIRVSDDGPGIAESALGHIFEPFFTTRADSGGTGLGLAISYGIVRDHRGTIEVESRLGQGTTFSIHLPALDSLAAKDS